MQHTANWIGIGLGLAGLIAFNALELSTNDDWLRAIVALAVVLWLPSQWTYTTEAPRPAVPYHRLDGDCLASVLGYLDAKSLAQFQGVDQKSREIVAKLPKLWDRLSSVDFCQTGGGGAALEARQTGGISRQGAYLGYIKLVLQRMEDELANAEAVDRFAKGLCEYTSSKKTNHGIIAMVCDLAIFDDRAVALAVSLKRQCALTTVLVEDSKVVMDFRQAGHFRGPMAFLPLSACVNAPDTVSIVPPTMTNGDPPPGFIGFAVDLIRLKQEHEYLRMSVLKANVFKDLQVWASEDQALRYMRETSRSRADQLHYVALDTYNSREPTASYPLNQPDNTTTEQEMQEQVDTQVLTAAQVQAREDLHDDAVDRKKLICLSHSEFRQPCHEFQPAAADLRRSRWLSIPFSAPRCWSPAGAQEAKDRAATALAAASARSTLLPATSRMGSQY
jgi:hypothetical protein